MSPHDSARLLRYLPRLRLAASAHRNDEVEKARNDGMGKGAPEGAPLQEFLHPDDVEIPAELLPDALEAAALLEPLLEVEIEARFVKR